MIQIYWWYKYICITADIKDTTQQKSENVSTNLQYNNQNVKRESKALSKGMRKVRIQTGVIKLYY